MLFAGAIFALILGAVLGSFANVLIIRMKEGRSIRGRSRCMSCMRKLRASELIPIASWFMLRGRCKSCGKDIHWQYPVVESAMAVLSLVAFLRHVQPGASWTAAAFIGFEIALSFILLVITAFDLRWKLIPMEFVITGAIILSAWRLLLGAHWVELALGAIVVSALLGMVVLLSRGTMMGEGDPFIGLLMGAVLGFPLALLGLLAAFVIGGSAAAALLIEGAVTRKTEVPFVPFLAAGTLIALWWSEPLLIIARYAIG
jgi:prepilin signal peptidase PulO-like enzyme (type II secretory pathway)